jgi:hypothetical protein
MKGEKNNARTNNFCGAMTFNSKLGNLERAAAKVVEF